jgi:hypothetical protein
LGTKLTKSKARTVFTNRPTVQCIGSNTITMLRSAVQPLGAKGAFVCRRGWFLATSLATD